MMDINRIEPHERVGPTRPISWAYVGYAMLATLMTGIVIGQFVTRKSPIEAHRDERALQAGDHSGHLTHDHMKAHGFVEVLAATAPRVSLEVVKDKVTGWNLHLRTENFTFTPRAVNGPNAGQQGHAHIYIDGEKLTRLYGRHYHLADMPPGPHVISVTLNANGHETFTVTGKPISAAVTIIQPKITGATPQAALH